MFFRISTFLLVTSLMLAAQEFRNIEVRTLCFGYSNGVRKVSVAGDLEGKSKVEFEMIKYLQTTQKEMTLTGGSLFLDEVGSEGKFGKWGKVAVPANITEVLLVFFPLDDADKPYRVVVFDDSSKEFPLESFMIVNMSSSKLRLIVGGTPLQVDSGERKLISEFKNKKANGQISYYAYSQEGENWKRLSTGFWDVIPRKRNLQIAFGNPKSKNVEMRGFEDGLPVIRKLRQAREKR